MYAYIQANKANPRLSVADPLEAIGVNCTPKCLLRPGEWRRFDANTLLFSPYWSSLQTEIERHSINSGTNVWVAIQTRVAKDRKLGCAKAIQT